MCLAVTAIVWVTFLTQPTNHKYIVGSTFTFQDFLHYCIGGRWYGSTTIAAGEAELVDLDSRSFTSSSSSQRLLWDLMSLGTCKSASGPERHRYNSIRLTFNPTTRTSPLVQLLHCMQIFLRQPSHCTVLPSVCSSSQWKIFISSSKNDTGSKKLIIFS